MTILVPAFGVLSNDTDPDTGETATLTVSEVNGIPMNVGQEILLSPSGATLTLNTDGTLEYDPSGQFDSLAGGASGDDTFNYTISDGNTGVDSATVTITINGVNDRPDAVDDSGGVFEVSENGMLMLDGASGVLANDTDVDSGDTLHVTAVNGTVMNVGSEFTLPSNALLTLNMDGSFTYDPNGNFESLSGNQTDQDMFTYTIEDSLGLSDSATVTITINGENDPPDAVDDGGATFTTDEDTALTILVPAFGVLSNDTDPDTGETATLTVSEVNGIPMNVGQEILLSPSGATLTLNTDGTLEYDPSGQFDSLAGGASGDDTFNYTISDGNTGVDSATGRLHVNSCSEKDFEQVVFVECGGEAFVLDADLRCPFVLQQAQCLSTKQAEVGICVAFLNAALVFSECDIQLPVKIVFN